MDTTISSSIYRRTLLSLCVLVGIALSAACTPVTATPTSAATQTLVLPTPTAAPPVVVTSIVSVPTQAEATEAAPGGAAEATAVFETIAADGCKIYHNTELGYSFHYPADATLEKNDDPLSGFSILGPLVNGGNWPMIYIAHPRDREEYRPPENVDLAQWLSDHYMLGETRLADAQIGGTTAIHLRHDRSPQSYASDRYFFARAGQLFVINILHTGDREDWDLYNHFLESFQFDTTPSSGG